LGQSQTGILLSNFSEVQQHDDDKYPFEVDCYV